MPNGKGVSMNLKIEELSVEIAKDIFLAHIKLNYDHCSEEIIQQDLMDDPTTEGWARGFSNFRLRVQELLEEINKFLEELGWENEEEVTLHLLALKDIFIDIIWPFFLAEEHTSQGALDHFSAFVKSYFTPDPILQ